MQQRRVSCLSCRTKKVKCDKKDPCTQCVKSNNNNNNSCVYPCQGTLGRPPKNAVFYGKTKNNDVRKLAIREFIFEYVGDQNNINCNNNTNNRNNTNTNTINKQISAMNTEFTVNKEWWILSKEATQEHHHLYTYFQAIYRCYLKRGLAIRDRFHSASDCTLEKPRIKFNDLQLLFTWWMSTKVNLMIKRNSILQLETNSVPRLAAYMFHMVDSHGKNLNNGNRHKLPAQRKRYKCKKDEANVNSPLASHVLYYTSISTSEPNHHSTSASASIPYIHQTHDDQQTTSDPLQSLPPEQAIHLINDFFLLHPHAILINKAKLMKEYWSDTANPLLLAVIYGTTQCFSQLLQGKPMSLWESDTDDNRNPFLTHAHSLLKNLSTCTSISDYKATAILGFFEVFWGYSKLGMSLLATSYLMGAQLGLWDKTFKASDLIEAELVNMTFWAVYRTTTLGCIELGVFVADSLVCRDHIFPPMNIYESLSYQSDLLENNINDTNRHSYLIESFYSGAVVTHYSGYIHACLPRPYFNIYGYKTYVPPFDSLDAITQLRIIDNVEARVHKVLDDFNTFIQQQRHKWTVIQRYTIETTYRLYRIHFRFLQPSLITDPQKYQEDLMLNATMGKGVCLNLVMDPSKPEIAFRLHQVRGDILAMVDDLEEILMFDSNGNGNGNSNSNGNSLTQTSLLPHDIMISVFETSARLLMLNYQMDSSKHVHDAMNRLLMLSYMQDTHQPPSSATKVVRHRLQVFLERHPVSPAMTQQQQYPQNNDYGFDGTTISANSGMCMQHLLYLHPENVIQQPVRLHHHAQPPPPPTASHISSSSPIPSNINVSKNTTFVDTSTMNSAKTPIIDTQRDDRDQFGHHLPLDLDDTVFFDWNSMMTQSLHPDDFLHFMHQDQ